jgi:integrase
MRNAERINFTKGALASLDSSGPPRTVFDARTRGLMVSVTRTGHKSFYVRRKIAGKSERIFIGQFPEWTVEQARARADAINADIGRGGNPAQLRRAHRREMTLDDLFDEYMSRNGPHLRRPDKPRNNYRLYLKHWGDRKLSTIQHHEVDRLHKDLARAKSNVTANIALKLLHAMFNKAINEWRIWQGDNPARGIRKLRERARDRFLQPCELPAFMLAVELEPSADTREFIYLALLTGARRSNLLTMRWDQLQLDTAEWRIPDTKNGTPQLLPLAADAVALLRRRRDSAGAPSPWVFPGSGETEHMVETKGGWRRVIRRAEILRAIELLAVDGKIGASIAQSCTERAATDVPGAWDLLHRALPELSKSTPARRFHDLRFHDLRRTLGSWQARTGASLVVIGKSLHHKSPASTAVYARLDLEPIRVAVDQAVAAMWRAAGLVRQVPTSTVQ